MAFTKLVSFTKKVADLPDQPTLDPATLKAQFDAAPDEVRTYLNDLITALMLTTAGDSGAKNIGATTVTGLTGTNVQTILESLNTNKVDISDKYSGMFQFSGFASLSANVETTIPYNGAEFISGIFTAPKTGNYMFHPALYCDVTNGNVVIWYYLNGVQKMIIGKESNGASTAQAFVVQGNIVVALTAGDTVKFTAISSGGSNVNAQHSHCDVVKVR